MLNISWSTTENYNTQEHSFVNDLSGREDPCYTPDSSLMAICLICEKRVNLSILHTEILSVRQLNHKQLETNECTINTVATDGLVLKHQTISIHIAD